MKTIPWAIIGDAEERTHIVPGLALKAWLAADHCLRDLGRDDDADDLKAALRDATLEIVEHYVHVRGTGLRLEEDDDIPVTTWPGL